MTARHYSNSQNSIITYDYSWFLARNISNFVSLPWKPHNRYFHKCKYTLGQGRSNVVRACYRNIVNRIVLMEYNLFSFRHKKKLLLPLNLSNFYFYSFFYLIPCAKLLKVSWFQNVPLVSSFQPKYQFDQFTNEKIWQILPYSF